MGQATFTTEDTLTEYGNGDAASIIEAVERLSVPELIDIGNDNDVAAVPKGMKLHSLKPFRDEYLKQPERVKGCAELDSLDSFIKHVNRFKTPSSAVFVDDQRMLAVYDYHDRGNPQFGDHQAKYAFPFSPEWLIWNNVNGQSMPQASFAGFIEEHIADVTAPNDKDADRFGELNYTLATPSQLLALSRGLLVRVEMEAVARPNLSTGETEVGYKEQHADATGAPLKVPGGFILLIPAFVDGVLYRIPVRLRYRVASGKVLWSLHMHRADAARRDAIKDSCEKLVDDTSAALFHGSPEE